MNVMKYKCPGCSTLCGGVPPPAGNHGANEFDHTLEEELGKELELDFGDISGTDVDSDSDGYFEELKKEVQQGFSGINVDEDSVDFFKNEPGRQLGNMDVESDVNRAEFLDRALWNTYHCPVDFCPFNMDSMAQANENLASIVGEMQLSMEDPVVKWTPEEDEQILALSSDGADEYLIADIVGRAVADIYERFDYLRLLSEVFE